MKHPTLTSVLPANLFDPPAAVIGNTRFIFDTADQLNIFVFINDVKLMKQAVREVIEKGEWFERLHLVKSHLGFLRESLKEIDLLLSQHPLAQSQIVEIIETEIANSLQFLQNGYCGDYSKVRAGLDVVYVAKGLLTLFVTKHGCHE